MSNFISAMHDLFDFLVDSLTDISNFFTSSTLGIILLGLAVFSLVVSVLTSFLSKMR